MCPSAPPPSQPDESLEQQLRELRGEYLAESTNRLEELRHLRSEVTRDERGSLAALRQAFHRLAGSGGSYGFPQISSRSREGEHLVGRLADAGQVTAADLRAIDGCIEAVAQAFAGAMETFRAVPKPEEA